MRSSIAFSAFCALTIFSTAGHADSWQGPLFGLATAPNGKIMVADAGAGIVLANDGFLLHALPGITDIAPIGSSSVWATRTGAEPTENSGQALLRVSRGKARVVANLFEFEETFNPHPAKVESNPFDVLALGGEAAVVADAAANDLLWVDDEGNIELLAIFPTSLISTASLKAAMGCPADGGPPPVCTLPPAMPAEAVPTSVALGPDGYYYVGELRGFPGPLGQSRIWRVAPWASWAECGASPDCELVFDGGFTSIIDLAFGPDGLLYVVEFDENGWFAAEVQKNLAGGTINACDVDTLDCTEIATDIPYITAITFGKRGQLWATRNAIIPTLASVVKIN